MSTPESIAGEVTWFPLYVRCARCGVNVYQADTRQCYSEIDRERAERGHKCFVPHPMHEGQLVGQDEGRKNDQGKRRMDLIPPEAMHALADVLTMGAAKYADRNWEKGFAWGRSCAALQRHFWAWMGGENTDPESGLSHMAHVLCNAAFLVTFEARHVGTDDRPQVGKL